MHAQQQREAHIYRIVIGIYGAVLIGYGVLRLMDVIHV
jgi:hypothetical protein